MTPEIQTIAEVKSEAVAVAGQVEIPFVPANERQVNKLVTAEKDGAIVVVGQPQRKKRKKDKKAADASGSASPKPESDEAAGTTPFDYSTVSNILDEGSEHEPDTTVESGRKRKQKQKQRPGRGERKATWSRVNIRLTALLAPPDTSAFRAPPKAPAEVRRGNQSRTFK